MAAVQGKNDESSEHGYCVAVMAGRGTKKREDKRALIYPVKNIVYEDEKTHKFVPCTGMEKFDNNKRTYRVSIPGKDQNGKDRHARIAILHYTESKADAKKYVEQECVKKRMRLPKLLELTPDVATRTETTRKMTKRKLEKENAEAKLKMKQLKAVRDKTSIKMENMLMARKEKDVLKDVGNENVPKVPKEPYTTMVDAKDVLKESPENVQTLNASKNILKNHDGRSIFEKESVMGKKKTKKSRKRRKLGNHENETSGTVGTLFEGKDCDKPVDLQKSHVVETIISNVEEGTVGDKEIHEHIEIVETPKLRITSSIKLSKSEVRGLRAKLAESNPSPPIHMKMQSICDEKDREIKKIVPLNLKVTTREDENCRRDDDDYVGIRNEGSTCFLISVLQVLYSITEFRKGISKKSMAGKASEGVRMLEKVFKKLDDKVKQIDTKELEHYYKETTNISFNRQQDSNEMLDALLTSVREKDIHGKFVQCELSELYTGMQAHSATNFAGEEIPECTKLEPFNQLLLDAKNVLTIEDALKAYAAEQLMEVRRIAEIQCKEVLSEVVEAKLSYTKVPKILFVHVQQSWWDYETQRMRKYNTRFAYCKELDLSQFFEIANDQEARYTLQSVIAHRGTGEKGHYIAFVDRNCKGNWYRCDDEVVEKCTVKNAMNDNYDGSVGDIKNAPYEAWTTHLLVYQLNSNGNNEPEIERADNFLSETLPLLWTETRPTNSVSEDEETHCQENFKNSGPKKNVIAKKSHNDKGSEERSSWKEKAKKSDNNTWQSKSMSQKMDVMYKSLMRLEKLLKHIEIKGDNNYRNEDNQGQQAKDVFEIPEKPDENGMVTTINGRRVYLDPYLKAADQTQMRRRVNFVLYALWSKEERLALTFNKTQNQLDCKKISKADVESVRQICMYLQNGKEAKGCKDLYTSKLRNWISNKLNSDRHRLKRDCVRKEKRKRKAQRNHEKGTNSSSGKDDTATEEGDTETESDNDATPALPARPFSDLESLLTRQRYPRDSSSSETMKSAPTVCGWEEIVEEMAWTNAKLQSIMTPDSYVTLDGKCYILEMKYEFEALADVIENIKEAKQDTGNNVTLDMGNEKERYPAEVVDYIVKKYFIENIGDDACSTKYRCNIQKVHKALMFKFLLLTGEEWNYYEITSRIRKCMGNLSGYNAIEDEMVQSSKEFIVTEENYRTTISLRNRSELCIFDGMAIIRENNVKSEAVYEKK